MTREEILEYPYTGVITRTIEGQGDNDDETIIVYEGVMDEHSTATDDEGKTLATWFYIISIPLTKDENGAYIIPRKGDEITLNRYGEIIKLNVTNAEPSQLEGVSIFATRNAW